DVELCLERVGKPDQRLPVEGGEGAFGLPSRVEFRPCLVGQCLPVQRLLQHGQAVPAFVVGDGAYLEIGHGTDNANPACARHPVYSGASTRYWPSPPVTVMGTFFTVPPSWTAQVNRSPSVTGCPGGQLTSPTFL